MKKILSIVFVVVIVLSLALSVCAFLGLFSKGEPGLTIVASPAQDKAQRPACFPDPTANYIPLPETENLAEGKPVSAGDHTDVYVNENVNDGKTDTYWESAGWPAAMTFDLGGSYKVANVAVLLNPSSIWEARSQKIAVLVSTDGQNFTEVVPAAMYDFDPETGNRICISFDAVDASFVQVVFTANTASRTSGAQAAEIAVYE